MLLRSDILNKMPVSYTHLDVYKRQDYMSNVKERIFGAVTIMSDEDAEKIWNLIQATFLLNNVEEVTPDPDEIAALNAYHSGDPDYQPAMSQEEVLKELGL